MGAIRKVTSVSTLGVVNYRSKDERRAKAFGQSPKMNKALAKQQTAAAAAAAQASAAQAQWARSQAMAVQQQQQVANQHAYQQWQAGQIQLAQQREAAQREWEAQQPLACQHCRQTSAPGSTFCSNCGSRSLAIAGAHTEAARPAHPAQGGNWKDRAKAAAQAKAASKLGLQR